MKIGPLVDPSQQLVPLLWKNNLKKFLDNIGALGTSQDQNRYDKNFKQPTKESPNTNIEDICGRPCTRWKRISRHIE